jgi:glycosyltransferase involved in cell wall biosynthesis
VSEAENEQGVMDISVILPILNERENLAQLIGEIEQALDPTHKSYEIIAVDDGSDDGSIQLLRELQSHHPSLRLILFRQNYGQSAAFDAGFRSASGDIVVTLDADLQNDPADIPAMIQLLEEENYDFVAGKRAQRKDGFLLRRAPSQIANFLIRKVTRTRLHDLGCSLKVYRRPAIEHLHLYGEMHRFIGVLVESMGARTTEMDVHHRPRSQGKSKYGITRTFKVILDLLTVWFMQGYQTKPIYLFGGCGMLLGFLSALLSVFVLFQKFFRGVWVHRNPLFILSMIFGVMAVQFLCLGLLAEIMVRTYFESQHKTSYLIGERVGWEPESSAMGIAPAPKVAVASWVKRGAASEPGSAVTPNR